MKFPKEAEAVRGYIRDNVGRPKRLPKLIKNIIFSSHLRWRNRRGYCCPLGLIKTATTGAPLGGSSFSKPLPLTGKSIERFIFWWDTQTDPQYAVDTVWGDAKET